MSAAYYNEIDTGAAAWLRELIKRGLIADGEVDERSITDVEPTDLVEFTQCHFFAGIGGWSYALRLAGWPDDRPVWTGSCPCQPFSSAGKQKGTQDERHLWPVWARLIRECRPPAIFGEQVASAIGHGWLDLVADDLEACGYAVGAGVLPAAGVGAPHLRKRLWFVANAAVEQAVTADARGLHAELGGSSAVGDVANDNHEGHAQLQREGNPRMDRGRDDEWSRAGLELGGAVGELGNAEHSGPQGHGRLGEQPVSEGREGTQRYGSAPGFWSDCEWLPCRDGKRRPVEPGTFPLAHGIPARVVRLRGYGNAIVPQVAAELIAAFMGVAA